MSGRIADKTRKQGKPMKRVTKRMVALLMTVLIAGAAQAVLIAYEDFSYDGNVNLTLETNNNGVGWTAAWATTGVSGLMTSGTGQSLLFNQSPDLFADGSTHVWSESSRGNERDFTTPVDIAPDTLYFTTLVRTYGGGNSTADLRFEFYVGAGATSYMRANVGISDGHLFVDGNTSGYLVGTVSDNVIADATTYLLAMKRTSTAIYAALIEADGNSSTLASEPDWQVMDAVATGVAFQSLRFLSNGDGGGAGIRVDELRIATDWSSAVSSITYKDGSVLAYDNFDYEAGASVTNGNGGTGWDGAWGHSGTTTSPLLMDTETNSLWFGSSEPFSYDDTGHIKGSTQRTALRNLASVHDLSGDPLYFAVLVRPFSLSTNNLVRARFEMYDGVDATGNMRLNVGLADNDDEDLLPNLYVQAATKSYPASDSALYASNSIAEGTYLLVCKRSGSYIAASVYEGGTTNSLSEPGDDEWQVKETGATSISLQSLYVVVSGGIVRIDELSMGSSFAAAISSIPDVVVLPPIDGGLPSEWVLENFGSVYAYEQAGGADGDLDGDLLSNAGEYEADTSPTNAASLLAGVGLSVSGSVADFTYQNGGPNADVYIDYRTELTSGDWSPVSTNAGPVSITNAFVHGISDDQGFYRLRAERND